jgi:hypothetical protein
MLAAHPSTSPKMAVKGIRGSTPFPRYLVWRNGRPRWQPGPMLRARGFQGRDLKDEQGGWMTLWAACQAAEAINAQVDQDCEAIKARPAVKTVGALLDEVEALPKFREATAGEQANARKLKRLSRDSREGYIRYFRMAREWAGALPAAAIKPADVEIFYDALVSERGVVVANRCAAAIAMAFQHGVDKLQWLTHNPFKALEKGAEDGRLVMWSPDENSAFVQCADWLGWHDVADAHVVALMTAQSRIDVLAMPRLDLSTDVFRLPRHKTGQLAYVPATRLLLSRLRAARQRLDEKFPGITYRHEIINLETGAPYHLEGSHFSEKHKIVRAIASGLQQMLEQAFPLRLPSGNGEAAVRSLNPPPWSTMPFTPVPSIWHKRFADLRDTALTLLLDATSGDVAKVANITAHSLRTIQRMADKHYFVRHEGMSRAAGGQLELLMARIGYKG